MVKSIKKLIKELEGLRESAEYHLREIVRNGVEIHEGDRAKASGYADAYSFCIFRLKQILEGEM